LIHNCNETTAYTKSLKQNQLWSRPRITRKFGTLVAVLLVSDFGLLLSLVHQKASSALVRSSRVETVPVSVLLKTRFNSGTSDVAIDIPTMAALAANVYEPPDTYDSECNPSRIGRIRLPGWYEVTEWGKPQACNAHLNGIHYEGWKRFDGTNGSWYVVIGFRGTLQTAAHWCSNFRDVLPSLCAPGADQYVAIPPLIDDIVSGIYDELGPDTFIYFVGHSLGGGLAELAGRSTWSRGIFSFDSSPVVGETLAMQISTGLRTSEAFLEGYRQKTGCHYNANNVGENDGQVHRVFEHGEVLAYFRLLKRWVIGAGRGPKND